MPPIDAPVVLMEPAGGIVINEHRLPPQQSRVRATTAPDSADNELSHDKLPVESTQSDATIYCIFNANPQPNFISQPARWFKDGKELRAGGRFVTSATPTPPHYPTLTVKNVTRRDAGTYDCQVANSVGVSERLASRDACSLAVNFAPSVKLRPYRLAGGHAFTQLDEAELKPLAALDDELVRVGDSWLVLGCEVTEAKPALIDKFSWFSTQLLRNTGSSSASGSRWTQVGETRTRYWQPPAVTSSVAYTCRAHNELGAGERSGELQMTISKLPGKF